MKKILLSVSFLFFSISTLFAQQQEPMADRLTEMLKSEVFSVGILLQSVGTFSLEDDNFNGGRKYDLGATRLDLRGTVDNSFTYRLQLDFRRQTSIMDAQLGYMFNENHLIVAGAFKPFLSLDLDPNPGATDFINRARLVGTMMNSREIGLTALGQSGGFNYRVGMYNGTGLTRQNDDRFMYTARLGYDAQAGNTAIGFGFSGALNQTVDERVGNTGLISEGDRLLYGGFFTLDSGPVFGAFEFMQTTFDSPGFDGDTETITGFFGTLGTRIDFKNELVARWDHLDFDLRGDSSDLLILGWNHQATRLISFQVNVLAQFNDNMDDQYGASALMQFQF